MQCREVETRRVGGLVSKFISEDCLSPFCIHLDDSKANTGPRRLSARDVLSNSSCPADRITVTKLLGRVQFQFQALVYRR